MAVSALSFPVSNNIILGAGRILFAPETSETVEGTAYRYLGDTPAFSLSSTTEKVEIDSSDGAVAETLVSIVKKVSRTGKLTIRHISPENLALFVMGTSSTITQTATGGTTTITAAEPGMYYKIGSDDTNGLTVATGGVHDNTVSGTAIDEGLWQFDTRSGLLYFTTGSGVTGSYVVVYTKEAKSHNKVATNTTGAVKGSLIFVSENTAGGENVVKISRCELAPDGEAAFKSRDNAVELGFSLNILTRGVNPQILINDEPVA
jgi:hypothetical protein